MYLTTPALWPALVAFVVLAGPLLVTDAREHRLPLPLNLGLAGAGAVSLTLAALWTGQPERLLTAALSAGVAILLLLVLFVLARGQLGFGDVILVAGLALYSGYLSPLAMLAGLWIGCLGTLAWALIRRSRGHSGPLAFGPGLILGTLAVLVIPLPGLP